MLHFGKKFKFGQIARNDDEETPEKEDQPHFAPVILTDGDSFCGLPPTDFDDRLKVEECSDGGRVEELPANEPEPDEAREGEAPEEPREAPSFGNASESETALALEEEAPEEDETPGEEAGEEAGEEPAEEPGFSAETAPAGRGAEEIFAELADLPLCERVYGLYGSRLMLASPDGEGGMYLFDDDGDWISAEPGDCAAYVRICAAQGCFRDRNYKTTDLEYVLKEKTFPLTFTAKDMTQYRLAQDDGFLPVKRSPDGRRIVMIKPLSLYRMKDLALSVEFADGRSFEESGSYLIDFDKKFIEDHEGSGAFRRIAKAAAEMILEAGQVQFTVQILKVRKNLVVCFPMDGKPALGDRIAGERIVDLAPADDGTIILRLGSDENVVLPLREGGDVRGQRVLSFTTV